MNISDFEAIVFNGSVEVFGNSTIAIGFLFVLLAYLGLRGKMSVEAAIITFMPVVMGLSTDKWIPLWVKGLFLIAIGIIWGLAIIRMTRAE